MALSFHAAAHAAMIAPLVIKGREKKFKGLAIRLKKEESNPREGEKNESKKKKEQRVWILFSVCFSHLSSKVEKCYKKFHPFCR